LSEVIPVDGYVKGRNTITRQIENLMQNKIEHLEKSIKSKLQNKEVNLTFQNNSTFKMTIFVQNAKDKVEEEEKVKTILPQAVFTVAKG